VAEETKSELTVVFSMDCLPAGQVLEVQGPESWDDAARAPVAFAEALAEQGMTGTFFMAPEALRRLGRTRQDLQTAGSELGLLCHPQLSGYQACLGSYNFDRQTEIIRNAMAVWQDALGEEPLTFRPGFFSANDYTYHVLCMQGFAQGSCSLPGRVDNEQCSMWFGTYPFPHHTDPLDRTAKGTMEFYEVPVTSDFDAAPAIGYETFTPSHLRIEEPEIHQYARDLVARHIDGMREDRSSLSVIHFVTSNLVAWGCPEDPHVERLANLCGMLRELAAAQGMDLRSRSLATIHQYADHGLPREFLDDEGA